MRLTIVVASLAAHAPCVLAQSLPGDKVARVLRPNVVRIESDWAGEVQQGFGFIVSQRSNEVYIVTANHVVRDEYYDEVDETPTIRYFGHDSERVAGALLKDKDSDSDLAVIRAPLPTGSTWHRQLRPVVEGNLRGTSVWFIGRGDQWYVPSRAGIVNQTEDDLGAIVIDGLNVIVGTSGAPLVSDSGIIGMMVRGEADSVSHALSVEHIERAFGTWGLPWGLYAEGESSLESIEDCAQCPELVMLPMGSYMMGSPEREREHQSDESPRHRVTVLPFGFGKYEVTFEQWDACVKAKACAHRPSDNGWGRGKQPVIDVNWDDARSYTNWLSEITGRRYRLPTEAEWEYAARAGTSTVYWWGDDMESNRANCRNCRNAFGLSGKTLPVGSFEPNGFGLFDTAGNVHEWVHDCYDENYENAPAVSDVPAKLEVCRRRGRRGGSWGNSAKRARAANRSREYPNVRKDTTGLRVARDP